MGGVIALFNEPERQIKPFWVFFKGKTLNLFKKTNIEPRNIDRGKVIEKQMAITSL